ncbi:MAG: hypothetical protein U0R26_04600 [Solirubrobacterales bacterium]
MAAAENLDATAALVMERLACITMLEAADIADATEHVVTRPRHVAINEVLVRPTEQRD